MELSINDEEFGKRERTLAAALIRFIKEDLEKAGLSGEQVRNLTTQIAFRVTSVLDDSCFIYQRSTMKPLRPVVMFADDADYHRLVTHKGVHSSMHEYVHAMVDVAFKEPSG